MNSGAKSMCICESVNIGINFPLKTRRGKVQKGCGSHFGIYSQKFSWNSIDRPLPHGPFSFLFLPGKQREKSFSPHPRGERKLQQRAAFWDLLGLWPRTCPWADNDGVKRGFSSTSRPAWFPLQTKTRHLLAALSKGHCTLAFKHHAGEDAQKQSKPFYFTMQFNFKGFEDCNCDWCELHICEGCFLKCGIRASGRHLCELRDSPRLIVELRFQFDKLLESLRHTTRVPATNANSKVNVKFAYSLERALCFLVFGVGSSRTCQMQGISFLTCFKLISQELALLTSYQPFGSMNGWVNVLYCFFVIFIVL